MSFGARIVLVLGIVLCLYGIVIQSVPAFLIGASLSVFVGVLSAIGVVKQTSSTDPLLTVHGNNRAVIIPLRKVQREIEELAQKTSADQPYSMIAKDSAAEAAAIVQQCARLLALRSEVKKALAARPEHEAGLEELRSTIQSASAGTERDATQAALEAKTALLQHFEDQERTILQIDENIRTATAVLSEMKAKLTLALLQSKGDVQTEGLYETMARLKTLSTSLDEAQTVFQEVSS